MPEFSLHLLNYFAWLASVKGKSAVLFSIDLRIPKLAEKLVKALPWEK